MLTVLIAEDDLMIAEMLEEFLVAHGYAVCGIARTATEGIALGWLHKPDLAIVDLHLAEGELGTRIATELGGLARIGVLYATANVAQALLTATDGDACIRKPYSTDALLRSLEIVAGLVATGTAAPPFPSGFRLLRDTTAPGRAA